IFSLLSYSVAVPSAIKVFNWTSTLYKGSITFQAPMLFALGFVALFTAGGMTGLFLAALGMDMYVHDTYFVIAHFHFIMVGGMVMSYMSGLHYWGPKAQANPWGATGLEWQTPSPPPKHNFEVTPVVVRAPYEYHLQKAQNET